MPLSWNEIKSRAISLAADPVSIATVAGRLAYLSKCPPRPMPVPVHR
jgi:hypothetical protein